MRAALAAAARNHDIGNHDLDAAEHAWDEYWAATRPVELTAAIDQHAGRLARSHALRGADAVHLASALAIGDPDLVVAVWDRGECTPEHKQPAFASPPRESVSKRFSSSLASWPSA